MFCGTTTVVVPELGGTTTVVVRAGGGSLLTQPASIAPRINKLDTTFIFVSSFKRTWSFEEPLSSQASLRDMGLPAVCRGLITHASVVGRPTPLDDPTSIAR